MLEHASAPPPPFTLCVPCRRRLSTLLKANPVEKNGAGTFYLPFIPAGGGALYPAARTVNQQVEVLHFMGGENSPRRVLCPWRVHRLAWPAPCRGRCSSDGRVLGVRVPERAEAVSCRDHGRDPRGRPRRAPREGEETQTGKTEKDKKKEKGQPTNTCSTDVDMQRRQFQPN